MAKHYDLFTGLEPFTLTQLQLTGKEVGRGSYATVYEVMYEGLKCAGKAIHRVLLEQGEHSYTLRRFREECHILSGLHHPNIVQFYGVYFRENDRVPILVMEFLPKNLTTTIEKRGVLPARTIYSILQDVALGLCYLHGHDPPVIHRDLSSNNVLLTEDLVAKISDFGMSKLVDLSPFHASLSTEMPGTPAFMPPEGMEAYPRYDTSMDIFSYGVIMIHLLCGEWPEPQCGPTRPDGDKVIGVSEADRREKFLGTIGYDHPSMMLIKTCIHNDPSRRPEVDTILKEIETLCGERNRCEVARSESSAQRERIKKKERLSTQSTGFVPEVPDISDWCLCEEEESFLVATQQTQDNSTLASEPQAGVDSLEALGNATSRSSRLRSSSASPPRDVTLHHSLLSSYNEQQSRLHSRQHPSNTITGTSAPVRHHMTGEDNGESDDYKHLVESLLLRSMERKRQSDSMLPLSPVDEQRRFSLSIPEPAASIWVPLSSPYGHNLKSICLSDSLLWAVDSDSDVYCVVMGIQKQVWKRVKRHRMDQVSSSSSGANVWGVYNCDAYVRLGIGFSGEGRSWKNITTKTEFSHRIKQVAVDEDAVWAVTTSGLILFRREVSVAFPKGNVWQELEVGPALSQFAFVTCCKGVVWAFNTEGMVYYRAGISFAKPSGSEWKVVCAPPLVSLSLTSGSTVWGVSKNNSIVFRRDVSTSSPCGTGPWWEVSIDSLSTSTARVDDDIDPLDMFKEPKSFIASLVGLDGNKLFISASSKSGVVVLENKRQLHACLTTVTGYHYAPACSEQFETAHWSTIAASATTLWLVSSDREMLYCLTPDNRVTFVDCPVKRIDLLAGSPSCVWIVSEGRIFTGSVKVPGCLTFDRIDLTTQLPGVELRHIACGTKTAWAVGTNGILYFRSGIHAHDYVTGVTPTWSPVGDSSQSLRILSIAVNPDDWLVWACDEEHNVYARKGITDHVPTGQNWQLIPNLKAKELCATNEKVFALSLEGEIFCRYGINKLNSNVEGHHWRKVPGRYEHIAVGEGDVWTLDEKGRAWKQQWVVMNVSSRLDRCPNVLPDWEVII